MQNTSAAHKSVQTNLAGGQKTSVVASVCFSDGSFIDHRRIKVSLGNWILSISKDCPHYWDFSKSSVL